ncbi:MAG: MarR family transcriptional regulator [Clostridia bacterium]|nr:MarR family transcriptional regulator [Clostridia bacterium]
MADIADVELVFNKLIETQPKELNERMSDTNAGIGAVLKVLDDAKCEVTCGDIAKKMNVSTARVAVLLKKMVAKDLIKRSADSCDARIVCISLTQKGKDTINEVRDLIIEHLSRIIDELGMEKINQFIELSEEIREVALRVKPQAPDFLKDKK